MLHNRNLIWFVSEFPALVTLGWQNYSNLNLCKTFIHYENEALFLQFNFQKLSSLCNKMQSSNSIVKKSISIQGQEISEWKYEVVALPKIWTKKFEKFCPEYLGMDFLWLRAKFLNFFVYILGQATTSYFHSEISWPFLILYFNEILKSPLSIKK